MKKVEAIIRTNALDAVHTALENLGITGMTVTNVTGLGREPGNLTVYRGKEYQMDFLGKLKIEILVEAPQVEPCIDAIMAACRTGNIGDGKIIVTPVEEIIRIRTAERNDEAL